MCGTILYKVMLCYIYFDPICPNKEIKSNYHRAWQNNLHVHIDIVCLNILVKIYPHLCFLDHFVQSYALLGILTQYPQIRKSSPITTSLANNLHVQIDIVCLNIFVKIYPHLCFLDHFVQSYALLGILIQYPQIRKSSPITNILGQ